MSRATRWFAIVSCGLAIALVAVIVSSDALYFVSGFLLMIPLGASLYGWLSLQSVSVLCRSALPVHAGETIEIPIEVVNHGTFPRFNLEVTLTFDPAFVASTILPFVAGHGKAQAICRLTAPRRGLFNLQGILLKHLDPLNLSSVRRRVAGAGEVVVYPRRLEVELSPILNGLSLGSDSSSHNRGSMSGTDFFGIRPYQPGDEWRRIHWPTTARTGSLTVVEREALSSHSLALVIDLSAAAASLEVLISAAARLAEDTVRRSGILYIVLLNADGRVSLALRHSLDAPTAFEALGRIDPTQTPPGDPVEDLPSLLGWGPSLILFTDHLDERTAAVTQVCRRAGWAGAVLLQEDHSEDAVSRPSSALPVWLLHHETDERGYYVEPAAGR